MKSASSEKNIGIFQKAAYAFKLLKMRLGNGGGSVGAWDELEEYETILNQYDQWYGGHLSSQRVLEIGYGARPWRLLTIASMGVDAIGIDLDQPTYGFNMSRLAKTLKQNGFERFAKSLVRGLFFDRRDLKQLDNELRQRKHKLIACGERLRVGDAAQRKHFADDSFTFAYSEDVFEHIPANSLPDVVENLYHWMQPNGIAIIRPNVYTGITGGHDLDFYAYKVQQKQIDVSRAWAHLWDPSFKVNTYLNKLRMADYARLFEKRFHILTVKHKTLYLGKDYLEQVRGKIPAMYSDEELLTNQVAFILKSRKELV